MIMKKIPLNTFNNVQFLIIKSSFAKSFSQQLVLSITQNLSESDYWRILKNSLCKMDFTTFISQNLKPIVYTASLVITNLYLLRFLRNRRQLVEKRQKIVNKQIISHEQALKRLDSSRSAKDENTYLIKGYAQLKNGRIAIKKDISYNQLWLIEPSLNKIAIQVLNKLNQYDQYQKKQQLLNRIKDFDIQSHLKWHIGSKAKMDGQIIPVEGYGQILDHQIFNVTCNYHKDSNKGFFTALRSKIAYWIQLILFSNLRCEGQQKIKPLSQNHNRAPFIMGPVIGIVRYFIDFIYDRPLLMEAKFQGGRLLPLSLSSSKQNIIQSFNQKIYIENFRILESLLIACFIYRLLSPHLKKVVRDIKSLLKKIIGNGSIHKQLDKFSMLQSSKVGENLVCIICYTNCRNTIFFNCKHMIMCDGCFQTMKQKHCPLCKGQIAEEKTLTKE